jgi:hypothetical protein
LKSKHKTPKQMLVDMFKLISESCRDELF